MMRGRRSERGNASRIERPPPDRGNPLPRLPRNSGPREPRERENDQAYSLYLEAYRDPARSILLSEEVGGPRPIPTVSGILLMT